MHKRSLPVIRDLCLEIYPGQIVAVAGASGSGKSLLAHSILDILPYNSRREGVIRYDGNLLTSERAEQLRGREIVLVPQGVTYLDPLMKVGPPAVEREKRPGNKTAVPACAGTLRNGTGDRKQISF